MFRTLLSTILAATILASATPVSVKAIEYREYKKKNNRERLFGLTFDKHEVRLTLFTGEEQETVIVSRDDISIGADRVRMGAAVSFDADGIEFKGEEISWEQIADCRILDHNGRVEISFFSAKKSSDRPSQFRRGNIIEFSDRIVVGEDEFIRGLVFSVQGDIEIYGEVNKDVVSLFGDIYVGPGAVARGDIVSMSGRVDIARDASIYGEIFTKKGRRAGPKHRFTRKNNVLKLGSDFKYNRVDGATIYVDTHYEDLDSLLPSVVARGGYGFASKRWRYHFGLEQTLLRRLPIAVGGSFYRRLASDDDWLLSDGENMLFALLATEDFKDYYEAEGGSVYLKAKPFSALTFETRYRYEETTWLDAHPNLWSLFGGNKKFSSNFYRVDSTFRANSIAEMDTTVNSFLYGRLDWDTRRKDDFFKRSAWHLRADFELSGPDLNSDFDYNRFTLSLRRYQKIHDRTMLIMRGMYGNSRGYLPMYRRFYLGGLGSLRGYYHKELMGTRFWMVNAEYRIDFPRTDFAASLIWDFAQIANDAPLNERAEIKHSLGMAVYAGDDFRVSLARRLDRSDDNKPKIYVRIEHEF